MATSLFRKLFTVPFDGIKAKTTEFLSDISEELLGVSWPLYIKKRRLKKANLPISPPSNETTPKGKWDGVTRILDVGENGSRNILFCSNEAGLHYATRHTDKVIDSEATILASGIGALITTFVAFVLLFFREKLPDKLQKTLFSVEGRGLNPWYRRFKTAFVFGSTVGQLIGTVLPIPIHAPALGIFAQKMLGVVFAIVLGLLLGVLAAAFLPDDYQDNKYFKIGADGWTKYGKNCLVLGGQIGAVIGGIIGFLLPIPGGCAGGMALGALAGGTAGFIISTVVIPIINKISIKLRSKSAVIPAGDNAPVESLGALAELQNFRTNYAREGIVIGGAVGAIIGGILGTCLFPGVGTVVLASFGAAVGGAMVGIFQLISGKYLSNIFDPKNRASNSFDYGVRTGAMFGNNFGMASILTAIFGSEMGVILGAATTLMTGIAGGAYAVYQSLRFDKLNPGEDKQVVEYLPWSQSMSAGAATGAAIGGLIGLCIGGPFGGLLGTGIGGIVCGLGAALANPSAREEIKGFFRKKFGKTKTAPDTSTNENAEAPTESSSTRDMLERFSNCPVEEERLNPEPPAGHFTAVISTSIPSPSAEEILKDSFNIFNEDRDLHTPSCRTG